MQELQQYKLATLTMGNEQEIIINSTWEPYQLNDFLRTKFPLLFEYFALSNPSILSFNADTDASYTLPYLLLVQEKRRLSVVPLSGNLTNPNGALCRYNKGRESASWRESSIWFRKPLTLLHSLLP